MDKELLKKAINSLKTQGFDAFVVLKKNSKIPIQTGWEKKQCTAEDAMIYVDAGHNIGINIRNGLCIADIDVKNDQPGVKGYKALCDALGQQLPKSTITQSGGWHCYCSFTKRDGAQYYTKMPTDSKFYGVEFKQHVGQCLLPGCAVEGNLYTTPNGIIVIKVDQKKLHKVIAKKSVKTRSKKNHEPSLKDVKEALYQKSPNESYEEWFKILCAIKDYDSTNKGKELAQAWSQTAETKYDDAVFNTTWDAIKDKEDGITIAGLFYQPLHTFANTTRDIDDFTCIRTTNKYYDHDKGVEISMTTFLTEHAHILFETKKYKSLFVYLLSAEGMHKAEHVSYCPREGRRYKIGELTFANSYDPRSSRQAVEPTTDAQRDAIAVLVDYFVYLFGDKESEQYKIMLNWFAYQCQHKGELLRWMPIIIGKQGVGKSFLTTILQILLGRKNVGVIEPQHIENDFNSYAIETMLTAIEEFYLTAKNRNKIKTIITNDQIRIVQKGKDGFDAANYTNYIGYSNREDCIKFDGGDDRRFTLIKSPVTMEGKRSGEYFGSLVKTFTRHASAIVWYLQHINIPNDFCELGAPMTSMKEQQIDESLTSLPCYDDVQEIIAEEPFLADNNALSVGDLKKLLEDKVTKLKGNTGYANIKKIIEQLGFVYVGRFRPMGFKDKKTMYTKNKEWQKEDIDSYIDSYDKEQQ